MFRNVILDICGIGAQEAELRAMCRADGWTLSRRITKINAPDVFFDGDDMRVEPLRKA
jgi:hypothetical protein